MLSNFLKVQCFQAVSFKFDSTCAPYNPVWYEMVEEELELSRFVEWSFVSCHMGVRKPDAAAYEVALESVGAVMDPARCIFVDDNLKNVEAAAALGIDVVLYEGDAAALEAALADRGVQF